MNSPSPASKAARARNAARWVKQQQERGAYRLSVLLPPVSAEQLRALEAIYGSKRAAVIAALADQPSARPRRPGAGIVHPTASEKSKQCLFSTA